MKAKKKRTVAELAAGNADVGQMLGRMPPQDSPVQPPELVQSAVQPAVTYVSLQPAVVQPSVTSVQPAEPLAIVTPTVTPVQPAVAPVVPAVTPGQRATLVHAVNPVMQMPVHPREAAHVTEEAVTPVRCHRRATGTPVPAAHSKSVARPPVRDEEHEGHLSDDGESLASNEVGQEHSSDDGTGQASGPDPCSICLDRLKPGERVEALPCRHVFHRTCVARWRASAAFRSAQCGARGQPRCGVHIAVGGSLLWQKVPGV